MKKIYLVAAGIIGLHILVLSNLQFTAWPEMLSFPYVIDKGFVIYRDFHHVYQPLLTYILLGVFKIFGFNILTLKTFTYVLIALTDLMLFLNIKKLTVKKNIAILSLGIYVLLQPIFDGNMLWFDTAVVLPILISIYFLNSNLFLSGLFVAIAFLIKQQAVIIGLPIFIYLLLLLKREKLKDILNYIYGCAIPVAILGILLLKFNLIKDYFFWTFEFPLIHLPKIDGYAIIPNSRELLIILLMTLTLFTGFVINFKKIDSKFYLLISILVFVFLSAFPRFSLFHLQPALAIYILIIGYLLTLKNKYFIVFLIPILLLWRGTLTSAKYEDRFYAQNDVNMTNEIKKISGSDKIYLLGPSSIYYVLTDTIPPKPWIENYVWHFEIPGLQEKVIKGWKSNPPMYIYWSIPQNGNWYDLGTYQPAKIVEYIKANYVKKDEIGDIEVWKMKNK